MVYFSVEIWFLEFEEGLYNVLLFFGVYVHVDEEPHED